MRKRWIVFAPFILMAFLLFIALGGWVVQLLWNWLMPVLFGWPELGFWQALGLLALCRILFGGFGGRNRNFGPRLRRRWGERWEHLSPEQRERIRERMRRRWGCEPSEGEAKIA